MPSSVIKIFDTFLLIRRAFAFVQIFRYYIWCFFREMWHLLKTIARGTEIKSGAFGIMYGAFLTIATKISSMIGNEANNIVTAL